MNGKLHCLLGNLVSCCLLVLNGSYWWMWQLMLFWVLIRYIAVAWNLKANWSFLAKIYNPPAQRKGLKLLIVEYFVSRRWITEPLFDNLNNGLKCVGFVAAIFVLFSSSSSMTRQLYSRASQCTCCCMNVKRSWYSIGSNIFFNFVLCIIHTSINFNAQLKTHKAREDQLL